MKSKIIAKNIVVYGGVERHLLEVQLEDGAVYEIDVAGDVFEACSLGDKITIESEELRRRQDREKLIQGLETRTKEP